jgi:GT2 family glycosyltransferase
LPDHQPSKTLLVSILTFGRLGNVTSLLSNIVPMLERLSLTTDVAVTIVVRNNDPTMDMSSLISTIDLFNAINVEINLLSGLPNTGFGLGHNENLRSYPSDYILILNDDIGFPDLDWIPTAISMLGNDEKLILIGDTSNPQFINPTFGNGVFPGRKYPLKYAEASVLLGRASLLQSIGMFDESFTWAMCEDSDLSLAVQSLGYRIGWIPMPHEHWRSSSFNQLPTAVRSSINERNRARFFAKWGRAVSDGAVGRHVLIDLWSIGAGDVFCTLPHLLCELHRLPTKRQSQFIVNTSHPDLVRSVLPDTVDVNSIASIEDVVQRYKAPGIASVRSIRSINYSWPTNIHALLAGALSLPIADAASRATFRERLQTVGRTKSIMAVEGDYCVFHTDFARQGHEGRSLSPVVRMELLRAAARRYDKVVVVGHEAASLADHPDLPPNVIDFQGELGLFDLVRLIANAAAHVGIDSLPAHIAQALDIPSIVFFGSVHPFSRLWPGARVSPLTAELSCIGCYHFHLEPSEPFCLRRDQACQREISSPQIEEAFDQLKLSDTPSRSHLMTRWHELQARQIELHTFHPSPMVGSPRPAHMRTDQTASLFYELSDRIVDLYESQRRSVVVTALEQRVKDLEVRLATAALELARADAKRTAYSLQKRTSNATTIVLNDRIMGSRGCNVNKDEDLLTIASDTEDPQIFFHPITPGPGALSVRVEAVAEAPDELEIFWSRESGVFQQLDSAKIQVDTRHRVDLIRIPSNTFSDRLWLRLDPLKNSGRIKLRATLLEHEFDVALETIGAINNVGLDGKKV